MWLEPWASVEAWYKVTTTPPTAPNSTPIEGFQKTFIQTFLPNRAIGPINVSSGGNSGSCLSLPSMYPGKDSVSRPPLRLLWVEARASSPLWRCHPSRQSPQSSHTSIGRLMNTVDLISLSGTAQPARSEVRVISPHPEGGHRIHPLRKMLHISLFSLQSTLLFFFPFNFIYYVWEKSSIRKT